MKVAIQGLGEVPASVLLVLENEKPDISYIICSEYQLKHVATEAGYSKSNKELIDEAAQKLGVNVQYHLCDVFNPQEVGKVIGKILEKVDTKNDELIVNYTGGSAVVRLLLGTTGIISSTLMKAKVVYAIKYPGGIERTDDHTEVLKDIFKRLSIIP
ncbi:MAG: hypothetical protein ACK4GQ_02835 [Candidatus Hadarchaeales archaeon]